MFFSRGVNKIQNPYTFRDYFPFYIKEIGHNSVYEIEYAEWVAICSDFYKEMMEDILQNGGTFKMPYGMGDVCISKFKVNINDLPGRSLNWKLTNETGKNVYHLNEHSRGYKYAFQWRKSNNKLVNKFLYRLVMTRANKRELARLIKEEKLDYYENYN